MQNFLAVLFLSTACFGQALFRAQNVTTPAAGGCGVYAHYATISIPSAPSTLTDFPNAIAPLSQWAAVGSGGQILHTTTQTGGGASITVPADFGVYSDSSCTTAVPFEWEKWVSATGTGSVLWAKQTRATGSATTLYAGWGSTGTTYLGNVNGTWNAGFYRVLHLPSATTVVDSVSSGCTYTPSNTPTAATGEVDGAVTFASAMSQEIVTGTCNMPTTPFTLSAWVNIVGGSFSAIIGNDSTNGVIEWRIENDNKVTLISQGTAGIGTSTSAVPVSAWHHIAVSYDAMNARFYLDGVADGAPASSQSISQAVDSSVGRGGGTDYMNGKIDEVEVSNAVRSADWIAATASNQATPITPTVIQ